MYDESERIAELEAVKNAADDFLAVNWVSPKTGDYGGYYAAFNEAISWNILIERDPLVNPQAKRAADNEAALKRLWEELGSPVLSCGDEPNCADALVTLVLEQRKTTKLDLDRMNACRGYPQCGGRDGEPHEAWCEATKIGGESN